MNDKLDIYIKDEGYAEVKFLSKRAKEWACKNGISNSLTEFGDTFCGRKVYIPNRQDGLYQCGVERKHLDILLKKLEKAEMIIESEISYTINR